MDPLLAASAAAGHVSALSIKEQSRERAPGFYRRENDTRRLTSTPAVTFPPSVEWQNVEKWPISSVPKQHTHMANLLVKTSRITHSP